MQDKLFDEVTGKVIPNTVVFSEKVENRKARYKLEFVFKSFCFQHEAMEVVKIEDKRIISKFGQLYGFSYSKLLKDINESTASVEATQEFIVKAITDRNVVLLYDDKKQLVNIVSLKHKQLPMKEVHKMVQDVLRGFPGAKELNLIETDGGYKSVYEVGTTAMLSSRVTIDYGRNDAKGRASIRFTGGAHVFVCTNQVLPYVHKDFMVQNSVAVTRPKLIHTQNITEQTKKNIRLMFSEAKEVAFLLESKLEEAKGIEMPRSLQTLALQLIAQKHGLGERWVKLIHDRLMDEAESAFGLSQALTFIGTRADKEYMKTKLCEVGGQVAILGKGLVPLLQENAKQRGV